MTVFHKKLLGMFHFNWSKLAAKILQFPNHRICVVVTGKRVKRGLRFGLKITDYNFYGDSRVTAWLKKALEKLGNSLNLKVEKCVK